MEHAYMPESSRPLIDLKEISLWRDRPLLSDISWRVERGQHWVVLGRNGAGKTLLLRILAGYLWPSRGDVWVLEQRFGRVDLRELRKDIGWVSASLAERIPPNDTVREVVLSGAFATFGLMHKPSRRLEEEAAELMHNMGLDLMKNSHFTHLSAGEKQRVLIARSSLPHPHLLILDEPCTGLDLAARESLLAQINRMATDPQGPTMIMVTHRVSEIMPGFTHGFLIHRGSCAASGLLPDIMTDDLLSRTMEIPVHVVRNNGRWQVQVI